ncbi:MAG: tripartite tricarboxylate transporter substrate binding protein [Reyranella sp.]|uniref:Bug family tripartite tricarboxylate transporter substrate binding protein n=1 Tax=Reyranella sp. TaxID=1929291 RepID=UPI001ACFEA6D|nr:tripartite tricarboxylate transporter substrate-binding protein [Reyranella sp.]MBN9087976.1 tripartite tricarboxylate transporter substrate binding protein [Reyranella sp.]
MRKTLRLLCLGLVSLAAILPICWLPANAEICPQQVKIIVSYPAGSPDDLVARILAQKLSEAGSRSYVENRPGASGMIGTAAAARAPANGCTMVIVNQNFVVQAATNAKISYDVPDSFMPVTLLVAAPETISINPSVPAATLKELIALVKADPGKYNYASPGYASSPHLAAEWLFKIAEGLDVAHVPFQGGPPAAASTVAGHTQILFLTLPIVAPLAKEGKLRLLALADKTRSAAFPDVPTLEEAGVPGHEIGYWNGLLVPKGTDKDVVDRLHRQVARIMSLPDVRERLEGLGYTPINGSAEAFAARMKGELVVWRDVVRIAGIKTAD